MVTLLIISCNHMSDFMNSILLALQFYGLAMQEVYLIFLHDEFMTEFYFH